MFLKDEMDTESVYATISVSDSVRNPCSSPKSSSFSCEALWKIDEFLPLMNEVSSLQSQPFTLFGQRWKLTLQWVKVLGEVEILFILYRLGPCPVFYSKVFRWNAGIFNAEGTLCEFGKGQMSLEEQWLTWKKAAVWFGPRFRDIVDENKGFIPGFSMTISVRLSCAAPTVTESCQTEPPATIDVSVQKEDEHEGRRGQRWKRTKDDERMVQQFRQMLRSKEDKEYILRIRKEEHEAKFRKFLEQRPKDDDEKYQLFAA